MTLSADLVDALRHEKDRSGVGTYRLFREFVDEQVPSGLSIQIVQSWLRRDVRTARKDYFDYILQLWRSLPDTAVIKITPQLRVQLRKEAERTGKGPVAMLRGVRPSQIDGLTSNTVAAWMSGKIRSAEKHKVDLALERWRSLPDCDENLMLMLDEHRAHLRAELERTGITHRALFQGLDDVPEGLTIGVFKSVLGGTTKTIRQRHYDYVVFVLNALPDAKAPKTGRQSWQGTERVTLTDEMRDALRCEKSRTGVSEKTLVAVMRADGGSLPPKSPTISNWITGKTLSARKDHYEAVLGRWRSLPDANAFWEL
ncbi:hypothetical protein [Roseobacter sp. MH60115]|uniref:hypothetical protein n=1 Tax=Roseobacter sp. MH60115 TaxID=2785324 RepID=UPI0018A26222|nr:hypothetical protein [Roseobacter sp. MH60115]